MRHRFAVLAALIPLSTAFLLDPSSALSRPAGITTAQGVYTQAQAQAGADLYSSTCAMCHGKRLEGTYEMPALNGRMIANWRNASVGQLFDYISRAMPEMAPGALSAKDNAEILAYLLQQNGLPPGSKPLSSEASALKAISIKPAGR